MDGDTPLGVFTTYNYLHHHKRKPVLGPSHLLIRGYNKKTAVDITVSSTGLFLLLLKKDVSHLLQAKLPECQLPAPGGATATPPAPTLTWDLCPGHIARMERAADCHRPTGRWNAAVWISWKQAGQRRDSITDGATE